MFDQSKFSSKTLKLILVALIGLQIAVLGFTFFLWFGNSGKGSGSVQEESDSFISFLPIWVAIFVPLLVRKKKEEQTEEDKQRMLWMMIILAGLVLLGGGIFLIIVLR